MPAVVDGAPTADAGSRPRTTWRICDVIGPHLRRTDFRQVAGVAAVVAADDEHQVQRLLLEKRDHRILALCVALQMCRTPESRTGAASPNRSLMAWRNISANLQRLVMSIVVWLAQPMRRSRSGSKPGDMAPWNRLRNAAESPL